MFLASDRAGYIHGVTYNVAGGKTQVVGGQQHVLDGRPIVLNGEAPIPVGDDPPGQYTDHGGCRFPHGRVDHRADSAQPDRTVDRRSYVAGRRGGVRGHFLPHKKGQVRR